MNLTEEKEKKIHYKRILKHLIKEHTGEEISEFCYRELYDVCKLYGVVYVNQLWEITDEVEKKYGVLMERVRTEIVNIE